MSKCLSVDLTSGLIVFLIALPLSVGIALASGAPPTAGVIAAIVGGVLGSLTGGCELAINGPAAGLIVIVLGAIQDLGQGDATLGFRRMLAASCLAGLLQMGFAVARLGTLGLGVPTSVIHGMLTAIGVIIMVKQIPVALGATAHSKEILDLIKELPQAVMGMNPEVALIAATGFIIILAFKTFKGSWAKTFPVPVVVVVAGILLARLFDFDHEHLVTSHWQSFSVGPSQLLTLPENLAAALTMPVFDRMFTFSSLRWTVSLALVASIESLLSVAAIDRMDPLKRSSNLDRELLSKGVCNTVCGLVGGLPIIAEMVRSSANVRNGAVTRRAGVTHGLLILVFLAFFPWVLLSIPLAALAAVLISVGYALANPAQFLHTAHVGKDHLTAYLVTFLVTLGSDLLIGVVAGLAVEFVLNSLRGTSFKQTFKLTMQEERTAVLTVLRVQSPLVFTNYIALRRVLETEGQVPQIIVDLSEANFVDHTSLDHLSRFIETSSSSGCAVTISFSENHKPYSGHPLAARWRSRR